MSEFKSILIGSHCVLQPLDHQLHADNLFLAAEEESIWTYLPYGPFSELSSMQVWLRKMQESQSDFVYAVKSTALGVYVGMCGYLAYFPEYKRIEIGHVWYGRSARKTKINTEATYLLLKYAFEELGCRRVEWKCHSENTESDRTARRMGFVFEGLFRQHMWIKGKNRDTKYYSIIDSEWPQHKHHFEIYLHSDAISLTRIKAQNMR
jgi:RimJ/RimL family protein N-acetyltransferase